MGKDTELASCVPRMPQPIDRGDMDKGGWCLGGDRDSGISFLGARIEIQRGSDAVSSLDGPRPYCVTGSQSVGDEATEIALAVLVCMRSPESRELCSRGQNQCRDVAILPRACRMMRPKQLWRRSGMGHGKTEHNIEDSADCPGILRDGPGDSYLLDASIRLKSALAHGTKLRVCYC